MTTTRSIPQPVSPIHPDHGKNDAARLDGPARDDARLAAAMDRLDGKLAAVAGDLAEIVACFEKYGAIAAGECES
jgi:hypothetical protein